MKFIRGCVIAVLFLPMFVLADNIDAAIEIDSLLTTIGSSNCTFVRNGKRYVASDAEDHLRMKFNRGKRYATSAETFIERLASRSSMSKKPYVIDCPGDEPVPSEMWLKLRLRELRKEAQ